ncbi:hypothetical protein JHK82_039689 [Glycine max]|uniref:Putative plastid-lipid-associated protein 8, chloroplastic n=1 Tax=Glycine soja TaxID=3848 RepID=A0A0B2SE87_GLYSO|nr:hypothetical protein JHK87_039672 [Glycine soja]KAG4963015.1 hypothetical protein JHK86_039883 [Glycine max]KAG4965488.1 hypothetical protein JHK85_040463 [Glycine max]KAG5110466.1 hypothetical protein JHK82_039689 [Glycine max]KAG5121754.1 hypothetical protein JHK84_040094 [Glycine max]
MAASLFLPSSPFKLNPPTPNSVTVTLRFPPLNRPPTCEPVLMNVDLVASILSKALYGGQSEVKLRITYVDEKFRLGLGSRGSLFVFQRI